MEEKAKLQDQIEQQKLEISNLRQQVKLQECFITFMLLVRPVWHTVTLSAAVIIVFCDDCGRMPETQLLLMMMLMMMMMMMMMAVGVDE